MPRTFPWSARVLVHEAESRRCNASDASEAEWDTGNDDR